MSRGRLLVVDGEPLVLASYAESLAAAGFVVAEASNEPEAFERLETIDVEAVFSGISTVGTDGLTFLRRLHHRSPDLPVVLMLERPDNRAVVNATELGTVQSLVKPIDGELLVRMASHAVHLWRSRKHSVGATRRTRDPQSALISRDQLDALPGAHGSELNMLRAEYDDLLAEMQLPMARSGMEAAFNATPTELGRAAVEASRRRG